MNNGETYYPTSNFEILLNSSQVYLYNANEKEDVEKVLKQVNKKEKKTIDFWKFDSLFCYNNILV